MIIPANAKYKIIQETVVLQGNLLNVSVLCEIAGVSRSGYYHYLSTEESREQKEEQYQQDFLLIIEAYQHRGYDKGTRGIYMRLLHRTPPVVMNIKKIKASYEEVWIKMPNSQSKSI